MHTLCKLYTNKKIQHTCIETKNQQPTVICIHVHCVHLTGTMYICCLMVHIRSWILKQEINCIHVLLHESCYCNSDSLKCSAGQLPVSGCLLEILWYLNINLYCINFYHAILAVHKMLEHINKTHKFIKWTVHA